jgi:hypothetical protein
MGDQVYTSDTLGRRIRRAFGLLPGDVNLPLSGATNEAKQRAGKDAVERLQKWGERVRSLAPKQPAR